MAVKLISLPVFKTSTNKFNVLQQNMNKVQEICYFNLYISVILWWSVLLEEKTGVPGENHRPVTSH
jgi:hypothetical protein